MRTEVELGTIRVRAKDIVALERTPQGWKKSLYDISSLRKVVTLFKAHDNFDVLIDKKNKHFLKGKVSPLGLIQGARIDMLPNGEALDKPYSLFAPHIVVHDESSHDHWDVLFENPNGSLAYVYTKKKNKAHKEKKFKKVRKFKRHHATLKKNVKRALKDKSDHVALPMFTLLKTYMRIGNEIYFRAHGHKGLSTLQKKDVDITGNKVTFEFLGKDGIPLRIRETFPQNYIDRLQILLDELQRDSFLFTTPKTGHPLSDSHFKHAFFKYCGEEFYPHIVRSFFATNEVKKFLAKKGKPSKEEAKEVCLRIAHKLGHRKFDKKRGTYVDSYTVTLNHYVEPELAQKMKVIMK